MDAVTFPSIPVEVNRDTVGTMRSIERSRFNPLGCGPRGLVQKKRRVGHRSQRRPTTLSQFHNVPTVSSGVLITTLAWLARYLKLEPYAIVVIRLDYCTPISSPSYLNLISSVSHPSVIIGSFTSVRYTAVVERSINQVSLFMSFGASQL